MPNLWFRFYSEFEDDPKVVMMPEAMQLRLVKVFCGRCKEATLTDRQRAFKWQITAAELAETKALFLAEGFIDENWKPLHWDKRQAPSDSSYERVKKYRDKRQSMGLSRGSAHLADPALYARDGRACIYCGGTKSLCIDHMYPVQLGGTDDSDNLGVACKSCNSGKQGRTPELAKMPILNKQAKQRYLRYVTVTLGNDNSDSHGLEERRVDKKRIDQSRGEASRANGNFKGELAPIDSIFLKGISSPRPSPFPTTVSGLVAGGYTFSNKSPCKDCGEEIAWWRSPKGASLPMNPDTAVMHMETCGKFVRSRA